MSEARGLQLVRSRAEARPIENVERLGPELQPYRFANWERPRNREVLVQRRELPHLGVVACHVAEAVQRSVQSLIGERPGLERNEEIVHARIEMAAKIRLPAVV